MPTCGQSGPAVDLQACAKAGQQLLLQTRRRLQMHQPAQHMNRREIIVSMSRPGRRFTRPRVGEKPACRYESRLRRVASPAVEDGTLEQRGVSQGVAVVHQVAQAAAPHLLHAREQGMGE